MAKLKLNPDATFKHVVHIPVPGGDPVAVEFKFKHRGKKALAEFSRQHEEWTTDTVMDCVTGWDFVEPFNRENVDYLVENYPNSAQAVVGGYIDEIWNYRTGN